MRYKTMEGWKITLAIIVVIIIVVFVAHRAFHARMYRQYGNVRHGYFVSTTAVAHPSDSAPGQVSKELSRAGVFPLFGESLLVARIRGRYMIVSVDRAHRAFVPEKQMFSDGVTGYIVVDGMTDKNDKNLVLRVCAEVGETVTDNNPVVVYSINPDTKLPRITVDMSYNADAATRWNFRHVGLGSMRRARAAFNLATGGYDGLVATGSMFTELPSSVPQWVTSDADLMNGRVRATKFINVKYTSAVFGVGDAIIEPWKTTMHKDARGNAFILQTTTAGTDENSARSLIAIPTSESGVFRIFDMAKAAPNVDTDVIEGHKQLIAPDGIKYVFSSNTMDSDSAHWTMVRV